MGTREHRTCVCAGGPRQPLGIRRPRVAGWLHPPGGGTSPRRPVTAHLRGNAPRSSAPNSENEYNEYNHALTRIEPMRYGPPLSGVCAHVGVIEVGGRGLRSGRRRAATQKAEVKVSRARSAGGVTAGRASRWIVRMERPKAHARAAARASTPAGFPGLEDRAGSLVRRCKGCRDVVSSREVPSSR